MPKGLHKRQYHKKDMNSVNRTALLIGGITAGVILLLMVGSFMM